MICTFIVRNRWCFGEVDGVFSTVVLGDDEEAHKDTIMVTIYDKLEVKYENLRSFEDIRKVSDDQA